MQPSYVHGFDDRPCVVDEIDTLEQRAAAKEAQLRVALDNMPGGMTVEDRDRNYVLFNSKYSELYEFPDGLVRVGGSSLDETRFQAERRDHLFDQLVAMVALFDLRLYQTHQEL